MTTILSTRVDGDSIDTPDSTVRVEVSIARDGAECRNCGQQISHYVDGWEHDAHAPQRDLCNRMTDDDVRRELELAPGTALAWSDYDRAGVTRAEPAKSAADVSGWCALDIAEDSITVQINAAGSEGDDRGAFTVSLHRGVDGDGKPVTYLTVPHPGTTGLHAPLVPVGDALPGVYRVL